MLDSYSAGGNGRKMRQGIPRYPTDDSGDLNLPSSPPASSQISSEVEQCSKRTR